MWAVILLLAFAIVVIVLVAIFGSDPYTAPDEIREGPLVTPKMTLFDYDWGPVFRAFFCILLALGGFALLLIWLAQFLPSGM